MATEPPAGWARRVILAVLAAGIATRAACAEEPPRLGFAELYKSFGVRGLEFSDKVRALAGARVGMTGFMAPPLKAESRFFVLTREPLTLCPFCQSDAEWPVDIAVVYLRRPAPLLDGGTALAVLGRLEVGAWTDPESGFVSQLRLVEAEFRAG